MNANDLNRNLSQYQDIYNIEDKDEFIYAILYELIIRDAKDDILKKMKLFTISNDGKINVCKEELYKQYEKTFIEEHYFDTCNGDGSKFNIFMIEEVRFEINFQWKLDIYNGYWEYHFIPNETKQKLQLIQSLRGNKNYLEKKIYKEWKSRAYFKDKFIRSEIDIIEDGEHKTTEYTYYPNYKRPFLLPSINDENKRVKIEIDVNLPQDVLELQLSKMIRLIHQDSNNILSNKNIYLKSIGEEYKETFSNPYKQKGEIVDMLLAYDYDQLRRLEIEQENIIMKVKKEKELKEVRNNTLIDKDERKIRNNAINAKYEKIYLNSIHDEISHMLGLAQDTAKKHIIQIKKLLENKNYLKLINGIPS